MARKLVVVLVALALGAGVAVASIPDRNGVIHGCRNARTGVLRVIKSTAHCRVGERPLNWNAQGPQGVPGPMGPQGPAGPQGEPGPGLESFDDLTGLACDTGANSGTIAVDYEASGEAHIRCVVPQVESAIRINEFSTGTTGVPTDEFVELVNAGPQAVDLSSYRLVYRSAAGTNDASLGTLPDGTILAPGAFFLFGGAGYAGAHPADRTFNISPSAAGGGLGLRDASGLLVDSVAWGTATNAFIEGTIAPAPATTAAPGRSDARHPDGHDTNDNGADFSEGDPTPGGPN
jgi:hypothetical protein